MNAASDRLARSTPANARLNKQQNALANSHSVVPRVPAGVASDSKTQENVTPNCHSFAKSEEKTESAASSPGLR